jgi:hypothetical protein
VIPALLGLQQRSRLRNILDTHVYYHTVIDRALVSACGGGHVAVADMLAGRGRTDPDAGAIIYSELAQMKVERLAVVQWIARRYGFTNANVRSEIPYIFTTACELGWLGTAQWIASEFSLGKDDISDYCSESLVKAYLNRKYDVARWLISEFDQDPQRLIASPDELEFQRWLRERPLQP